VLAGELEWLRRAITILEKHEASHPRPFVMTPPGLPLTVMALDAEGQHSYDLLETFLAVQVEGERFAFHNYPLNQLFGVQNGLPTFLATQHAIASKGDAESYLARLAAVPRKLDQVLEGVRHRESLGILPPRFVVEKVRYATLRKSMPILHGSSRKNRSWTSSGLGPESPIQLRDGWAILHLLRMQM
jgi:hypothetical protein